MRTDVFCRVVDNYGDIGVTYRLVRQLREEYNWDIRLWVDQLDSFKRLEPAVNTSFHRQLIQGIEILDWGTETNFDDICPAEIVIASFSCDLPTAYQIQMHQTHSLWINLDYLSAEQWVETCHGLPSLLSDGLASHFFFPGFNDKTGGLLREQKLITQRDQWQNDFVAQAELLARLGVSADLCGEWLASKPTATEQDRSSPDYLVVSLFCYPHADIRGLLDGLEQTANHYILLVPDGVANDMPSGRQVCHPKVTVIRFPFLPQPEYDRILWMSDLNFVRGEDSMVRALWAAKPMIWQIYPQTASTHLVKLEAWLALAKFPETSKQVFYAWNACPHALSVNQAIMQAIQKDKLQSWSEAMRSFSRSQSERPDLASKLVDFCQKSALRP